MKKISEGFYYEEDEQNKVYVLKIKFDKDEPFEEITIKLREPLFQFLKTLKEANELLFTILLAQVLEICRNNTRIAFGFLFISPKDVGVSQFGLNMMENILDSFAKTIMNWAVKENLKEHLSAVGDFLKDLIDDEGHA